MKAQSWIEVDKFLLEFYNFNGCENNKFDHQLNNLQLFLLRPIVDIKILIPSLTTLSREHKNKKWRERKPAKKSNSKWKAKISRAPESKSHFVRISIQSATSFGQVK